jgi:trans-feruloyl-CoA hydratase/vanillin synthase
VTTTLFEDLELSLADGHATIRFLRPAKKNAFNPKNHEAMSRILDLLEARSDIKVVVFTGVDEVFCAGMDLEEYFFDAFDNPELLRANFRASHAWMRRWKDFPAVTISLINGLCIGGGMHVAVLSDIGIAADEASFCLSEVNFGIFPAGGTSWSMGQHMTRKQALYWALTAERFDGRKAVELGIVTLSVPRARLAAEAERVVGQLVTKDRHALRYTKRAYERSRTMSFAEAQEWETAFLFDLSFTTGDRWIKEGLSRFKRRTYRPALDSFTQAPADTVVAAATPAPPEAGDGEKKGGS